MINNKVCVCALLDKDTTNLIEPLQRKLGRKKPSAHITIGTYIDIEPAEIITYTEEFCQSHTKMKVEYRGIGILMGEKTMIDVSPRVAPQLLKMHHDFHQKLDEKCIGYTSLYPFDWTPHTTLYPYSPEALDICMNNFRPIEGTITGLKVVDILEDDYIILAKYELTD